jgi:uncharacterized protein
MVGGAYSGVIKLWAYLIASFGLGAWISPVVYNAGKALAEVSSVKQTNGLLEWLADLCRTTEFPRFFIASIIACALVLLLPLLDSLSASRGNGGQGQRLVKNPWGFRQGIFGFGGMLAVLLAAAGIFGSVGLFSWHMPTGLAAGKILQFLALSFAWALVQEWGFRGLVMGVFLRAMPATLALAMTTIYFALVHFLIPPPGLSVVDPDASGVGFELLRGILRQFLDPRPLVIYLLPWLALGFVLSALRLRTASLWLPVGIHTGWIFGHTLLACYTHTTLDPMVQSAAFVGLVLFTGLLAHTLQPRHESNHPPI